MPTTEALKAEITSELDQLPPASLRTLADFVAFLRSRNGQDRDAVERYAAAYQEQPETEDEVAETYAMSRDALAGEPWE